MNCADVEILICDYQDGTLTAEGVRGGAPPRQCPRAPSCGGTRPRQSRSWSAPAQRAPVEPPPELITRILFERPWSKDNNKPKGAAKLDVWNSRPDFAAAVRHGHGDDHYFAGVARLARSWRRAAVLRMSSLEPAEVWRGSRTAPYRAWGRTGKVLRQPEVRVSDSTHPREWQQQAKIAVRSVPEASGRKKRTRQAAIKATPEGCPLARRLGRRRRWRASFESLGGFA